MGARSRCYSRTTSETLEQMGCNPSVGGMSRGHQVKSGCAGRRHGDRHGQAGIEFPFSNQQRGYRARHAR
ncbi:MAG: hypothetical protein IPJ36_19080 [Simplicispira sp.]|nr:hypothetical protein [Simplicispira sp.]